MDATDKRIISLLKTDSRRSAADIATLLGMDEEQAASRIKRLESSGVIVKYTAITDDAAYDNDVVQAMIEVKVTPQKSKGFDAIAAEICAYSEVKSLYLMSGGYDLAVLIEGNSLKEVSLFVSEKLSAIESVIATATHFILKKYKVEGVITGESRNGRLPVQP